MKRALRRTFTVLFASYVLPAGVLAQAPAVVPLDYGAHDVGFTVVEALDSTRAFRPLQDFRGRLAAETARPVQVSIWYPADAPPDVGRMRAGEFRLLQQTEVDFDRVLTRMDAERLRSELIEFAVGLGRERPSAAGVWDGETPPVRDAPPLPGPFPTVLYLTDAGVSNPLLPAYLASHGFVVASFPGTGRMTAGALEFTPNALTLDTSIDDAGFVHALLRRLPYADTRRLGVASFSGASLAALLWTMRDMQARAFVSIEGWERYRRGADILSGSVHFEPHRVRVPYLMIERAADETSPQYAKVPDVVGALRFADIVRVAFRDASHGDFLSHVSSGHTPEHRSIYAASARTARLFLEATLEADGSAARELADLAPPADDPFFTVARDPATAVVPTEEELYRLAEVNPTAAAAAYREAIRLVPGSALFREHVLTRLARLARTEAARATIMEIVAEAYPDTAAEPPPPLLSGADPAFLAISVSDLDQATAWYTDIFGFDHVRDVASADGTLRARILFAEPVTVELIHHASSLAPGDVLAPGAHRFQLQGIAKTGVFVDDIEGLHERLSALGADIDPRIGTDRGIGARFFILRDLDGNRIQMFERCGERCGPPP